MTRVRTSLYLSEWPRRDRELWRAANRTGGFLEPDGKAARWRDKTRKGVAKRYGLWLGYLASANLLDPGAAPSYRIDEGILADYVHWLEARGNASTTVSCCVRDLNEAIRVMEPNADRNRIKDLAAKLRAREEPVRAKHTRIMHPDDLLSGALAFLDEVPDTAFH
ncbi:MAG: hypothetical protein HN420_15780, partial [Rhodospirillaceae bacterium]|nr:hypothetical protein [Rhodospirillaceae bacterium]